MAKAGSQVLADRPRLAVRIGIGDSRLSAEAKANVQKVLASDRLSYGPFSRQFEAEFALLQKHRYAAFVNSGTSALQIGLAAMKERYGWVDGSAVLLPAQTFVATLNVIIQNRLTPILVDVDPVYYDLNPFEIVTKGEDAVAVLPVSLFGQPYNEQVADIARIRHWRILLDSCETMFVGGQVGLAEPPPEGRSTADVTAYSTYVCHLLNTGVGGFAATSDPDLAVLIRSLANHGRDGIYAGIDDPLGQQETMAARFSFERIGYSYRATELEAAIGCAEIETWRDNLAARRRNALFLTERLADLPLQLPRERVPGQHAYMMYPIVCEDWVDRDSLTLHLEANGIETRHMMPLINQPYVKRYFGGDERGWVKVQSRLPVAARINRQGFYIGVHQHLTMRDLEYTTAVFHEFFSGRR